MGLFPRLIRIGGSRKIKTFKFNVFSVEKMLKENPEICQDLEKCGMQIGALPERLNYEGDDKYFFSVHVDCDGEFNVVDRDFSVAKMQELISGLGLKSEFLGEENHSGWIKF